MINKQNPNPWARWKALFFLPLAALLTLAFARPEINREIEQISALKGTEILQENTGWTEEKFLDELRKCLPAGVSRDLSYEDTWNEIAKTYQFIKNGKYSEKKGMAIRMNARGQIMINGKYATMEDVAGMVINNLAEKGKAASSLIIEGKEANKIIRYAMIQRDMNAPPDDYQKLLNAVGEAYISKRNEMARQYFQVGYDALDAEKKSIIDEVVPILVWMQIPRGISSNTQRTIQGGSWKDVEKYLENSKKNDDNQLPTEEEWKEVVKKLNFEILLTERSNIHDFDCEKTWKFLMLVAIGTEIPSEGEWKNAEKLNREISYNGKATKLKEALVLLRRDINADIGLFIGWSVKDYKAVRKDGILVSISGLIESIDTQFSAEVVKTL